MKLSPPLIPRMERSRLKLELLRKTSFCKTCDVRERSKEGGTLLKEASKAK